MKTEQFSNAKVYKAGILNLPSILCDAIPVDLITPKCQGDFLKQVEA